MLCFCLFRSVKVENRLLSHRQSRKRCVQERQKDDDRRRRRVGFGQGSGQSVAGARQTVTGRIGMRTEHQVRVKDHVRAKCQSQRLAVDGRVPGDDQLQQFLRRLVAKSAIRVDRCSLLPKVRCRTVRLNQLIRLFNCYRTRNRIIVRR